MKKTLCILAVLLVIAGGVLMLATFPTIHAEQQKNDEYADFSEDLKDRFDSVEVHAVIADVIITSTDGGNPSVVAKTDPAITVRVESNGTTLVIEEIDQRKWYQKIGIDFTKPSKIEIHLANGTYTTLNVLNINGDITVKADLETIAFENIFTENTNGDTEIKIPVNFVSCNSKNGDISFILGPISPDGRGTTALVKGMTTNGDIVDSSFASHKSFVTGNGKITSTGSFAILYAKTTNGDIFFNRIYGDKVTAESVNGDITAAIMQPMNYVTSSKNGRVTVPKETGESPFVASTVNGDITIEIAAGIELLDD